MFECMNTIKSSYAHFLKTYVVLASHSKTYPAVDKARFEILINKFNILSSALSIDDCFKIFDSANKGEPLNRPQFLSALLLLVHAKFLQPAAREHARRVVKRMSSKAVTTKVDSSYLIIDMSGGVKHFFDILLPKFAAKRTWQEFRTVFVQKPKISQILIDHMTFLRRVYSAWSEISDNKRLFSHDSSL